MSWIEKSWYQNGKLIYLLAPLSLVFWLLSGFRRLLFKAGFKRQVLSTKPVIVVGNISVGGTGKTPFVVYLCELLKKQGFKVGVVSRGYGAEINNALPFPRQIELETEVKYAGDEPKLLLMKTACPVVIGSDRVEAVQALIDNNDIDVIISDDGLQHYKMARSVEIVLVDGGRKFGNGWLLPVGPLRELPSRLDSVDFVIENQGMSVSGDYQLTTTRPYQLADYSQTLENMHQVRARLVSGIGNPGRFVDTARSLGLEIESTHWFPDHHNFSEDDFASIQAQCKNDEIILMTEKDAVKCHQFAQANWYVLPISAKISPALEQKLVSVLEQKIK